MSRVFLAEEVAFGRKVAIKVLPAEMASGLNRDRFRREVALVTAMQHPNIVPVLSAEVGDEFLYYIMPFIEGESLRARLAREGELPLADAVRLLREVADALAYAHARGVVHRDIKPDNVMLSSGHALVTDFGIAKSLGVGGPEGPGTPEAITSLGMALGTPTYMAPEQAAGDPLVDHRADIYALGVVGYELLVGRPPFSAATPQAILAAHVTQEPDPVRRHREAVPEALEHLVMRCLAKRASDRPQQAVEILTVLEATWTAGLGSGPVVLPGPAKRPSLLSVAGLFLAGATAVMALAWVLMQWLGLPDWIVTGALVLLVAGFPVVLRAARREGGVASPGGGVLARLGTLRGALIGGALAFGALALGVGGFMGLRAAGVGPFATLLSAGTLTDRDYVVVAEFTNSTGDSVLAASLTEALKVDLSQSSAVRLLPDREIADALALMQRDPEEPLTAALATELAVRTGAKAVVAGEISRLAEGFLLSARVLGTDGGTLLATRATAADAGEVIGALETLSHELREGIGESFRSIRATPPLEQVSTSSLEALRLYTIAMRDWSEGQSVDAQGLLRQAIALDSNFAMAWRRLGGEITNANGDPAQILEADRRAYELRDRLTQREALLTTANYLEWQGAFDEMIETYERILASWPDDRSARNNLGLFLRVVGRYADAERIMRPAVDSGLAPASTYYNLVVTLIPQGKLAEARQVIDLLAGRMSDSPLRWQMGAFVAFAEHRFGDVLALADSLRDGGPRYRYWGESYATEAHLNRGELRAAKRTGQAAARAQLEQDSPGNALEESLALVRSEFVLLGDTVRAVTALQALLAATPLESLEVMSRPYGNVIRLQAELGLLDEARRTRDAYFAAVPELMREGSARGLRGLAQLAIAEGRPADAIPLARRAGALAGCDGCNDNQVADAFEALGEPDSAIVARERLLRPPTYGSDWNYWRGVELPMAYLRLGELYEARGDRQLAADRYATLVEMWEPADPELQPVIREVERRLALLTGEG